MFLQGGNTDQISAVRALAARGGAAFLHVRAASNNARAAQLCVKRRGNGKNV
ncbi:hypothetical protein HMPREF3192_01316 [Atopobium deltae]|uniref:Uncharacterized protein n=1 Tax=Atopobium deltae TaxID=1393034 RepID=A0A133XPS8_9ACTN|nr:hypothetical protein HMPREF3192_01316 [Atopobium deltae]